MLRIVPKPKLTKEAAGYMPPQPVSFECEHCLYWQDPNACKIVAGDIDPEGCCNLFKPNPDSKEDTDADSD